MKCGECRFFTPHVSYPWIGYCSKRGNATTSVTGGCELFGEYALDELLRALEARGYVYCATCRTTLTDIVDLREHYEKKHSIHPELLVDEEIHLEVYSGD